MAAIALIGLLALALRVGALGFGLPSWLHPDEFSFVFIPLNFFGGDLNPHFFTYPTLHYYLLALVYLGFFAWENLCGAGYSLEQFAALHYFWERGQLLWLARWVSALYGAATVVWAALLARRVYGAWAGWAAGALLAVGVVHLRQSHLAGVDAALSCFFVGAVWASVRLLDRCRPRDYLLAGGLVGLAAACKYPGALAGVAVAAAHVAARRSPWARPLWLSGAAAAGVFALLSPYVLLDFDSFATHFSAQVAQMERGRGGDLGRGWWHHLRFGLLVNGGWVALLMLGVGVWETARRRGGGWVVLAAFVGYWAAMGAGQAVFARYALPLMALQAVLAGGGVARWRGKGAALVLALLLAQPLYASWEQLRLVRREDTRVQARAWMEDRVPAGAVVGNFGGWAGDVRLRNYEDLWWAVSHFERVFGRDRLQRAVDFLAGREPPAPFYSYALQRTNSDRAGGSMAEVERLAAAWVVLHRHPLGYSRVDSAFAAALAARAQRVARFSPGDLRDDAAYDLPDAFYLPLGGYGGLQRPGPEIEIWRLRDFPPPAARDQTARDIFARSYVVGAASALGRGALAEAEAWAQRALALAGASADAFYVLGTARQLAGDAEGAVGFYERHLELADPADGAVALSNLGALYEQRGQWSRAEAAHGRAVARAPWHFDLVRRFVDFYRARGDDAAALRLYEEKQPLFPDRVELAEALGPLYEQAGREEEAVAAYGRAVRAGSARPATYLRLAELYGRRRQYPEVVAACRGLLDRYPEQPAAHRLLALVLRHQGREDQAAAHARRYLALAPEGESAAELGRWLRARGE